MKKYIFNPRVPVFVLIATVLSACATLDRDQCEHANWFQIGHADGARGYDSSYFARHENACSSEVADLHQKEYFAGRSDGLKEHCSNLGAFHAGESGYLLSSECPSADQPKLLENYNQGVKIHALTKETTRLDNEIDQYQKDHPDSTFDSAMKTSFALIGMENLIPSATRDLEDRRSQALTELQTEKSLAPVGTTSVGLEQQQAFMPAVGATIGSVLGFGLGHAIQGRYGKDGWIYTATETASIGLMIGASACGHNSQGCESALITAGALSFITEKVFEIVDLWKFTVVKFSGYATSTSQENTRVVQLIYNF